ncbi:MAG TPA: methyltransferase domain-containing protein [Candidatus Nanoarchaeia archaeon]|nr:methyltransferase domain-containing protein [Candidatus Nanoarchaeia archaeon]
MTGLFNNKGFENQEYRPLIPKYYTLEYKNYIKEESRLLINKLKGPYRILEAGVGIGRMIPKIAPIVKEFFGVDNSEFMVKTSKEVGSKFTNVKIVKGDLEHLAELFPSKFFDFSLLLWNTLGNVKDEVVVLKELSKMTKKSIIITVHLKGKMENRKRWYQKVGINIIKIDPKKEIFYFDGNIRSKSYSLDSIKKLAKKSHLHLKDSKVIEDVVLWVELSK